ncbi:hypothetical protein SPHINGOR109_10960 [Sphingorhabdus sp. 109]|nr:hypothetical protein SPHINGOR109_10960 [Sphingorhabdus sp. 109]
MMDSPDDLPRLFVLEHGGLLRSEFIRGALKMSTALQYRILQQIDPDASSAVQGDPSVRYRADRVTSALKGQADELIRALCRHQAR